MAFSIRWYIHISILSHSNALFPDMWYQLEIKFYNTTKQFKNSGIFLSFASTLKEALIKFWNPLENCFNIFSHSWNYFMFWLLNFYFFISLTCYSLFVDTNLFANFNLPSNTYELYSLETKVETKIHIGSFSYLKAWTTSC